RRKGILKDEKFELPSLRKPLIKIENLSFKYPESQDLALRNVNLEIGRSEALAIIGENGSGKTTLAKHLNGLLKPTSGRVFIDSMKTTSSSVAELSRIVGFVFQNPEHQIFADTVYEEVEFGLKNLQVKKEERKKKILEVLERTDLLRYRDSHPLTLSGGEKQRLAIASILVMQPQILVLDEPTNGLDLRSAEQITTLVEELQRTGHTIILITHEMDLVAKIAKRVVVLKEGCIVADGPLKRIFNDEELLRQNSLKEPQITRLSKALGYGISLTVEELCEKVVK
ncbi:MAG: energy-coupling factor ABC transporter ATP-binding protein, partial [Candidatus Methanofastidiosia archaeon]